MSGGQIIEVKKDGLRRFLELKPVKSFYLDNGISQTYKELLGLTKTVKGQHYFRVMLELDGDSNKRDHFILDCGGKITEDNIECLGLTKKYDINIKVNRIDGADWYKEKDGIKVDFYEVSRFTDNRLKRYTRDMSHMYGKSTEEHTKVQTM